MTLESELIAQKTGYSLWRSFVLRTTGFPLAALAELASEPLFRACEHLAETRAAAMTAMDTRKEGLRGDPDLDARARNAELKRLGKLGKRLRAWNLDGALDRVDPTVDAAIDAVATALREVLSLHAIEAERSREALHRLGSAPRIREAIAWQNRQFLDRAAAAKKSTRLARMDETLERYLLRYHSRCESIGFFGPAGWGEITEDDRHVALRRGSLVCDWEVFFEDWPIQSLCDVFFADPVLRQGCRPRRSARTALLEAGLLRADGRIAELSATDRALLNLCDGQRSLSEIADDDAVRGLGLTRDQVVDRIARFEANGDLVLTPEIPHTLDTLGALREHLQRVEAKDLLAIVDELDDRRRAIAEVHGDPEGVRLRLGELETRIETLSGEHQRRLRGTVVFQECKRGDHLRLGRRFAERIDGPLGLVLASNRWQTEAFADAARAEFRRQLEGLRSRLGTEHVPAATFFDEHFTPELRDAARGVRAEFTRRWWSVLGGEGVSQGEPIVRSVDELRDAVERVFASAGPGWRQARITSPDLMIAATNLEAVERGDYLVVLSELHDMYTCGQAAFVWSHPEPERLQRAMIESFADAPIFSGFPPYPEGVIDDLGPGRAIPDTFLPPESPWFATRDEPSHYARRLGIPLGELVIVERGDALRLVDRQGSRDLDLLELVWPSLMVAMGERRRFCPDGIEREPRITVDGLVLARARWNLTPELPSPQGVGDDASTHLELHLWARRHGLPRFTFFSSPVETKPLMIDLASPGAVRLLARGLRRAQAEGAERVAMTEMLPGPDQLWFEDADGARYCTELRITCWSDGKASRRSARDSNPEPRD